MLVWAILYLGFTLPREVMNTSKVLGFLQSDIKYISTLDHFVFVISFHCYTIVQSSKPIEQEKLAIMLCELKRSIQTRFRHATFFGTSPAKWK